MKKDGKYRFSLQFGAETEEQQSVGELLERLGNRKSAVVVAAVSDYILAHPELQSQNSKIEVRITSGMTQEKIEQLLQAMVDKRLASLQAAGTNPGEGDRPSEASPDDVDTMLDNLDLF